MLKSLIISILVIFVFSGCKSTIPMPMYENQPITNYGDKESTTKSVEKSIIKAALALGWKPVVKSEGEIVATLDIRKHQLVISIQHNADSLSVKYISSVNMKYDGYKIHRQYANWVSNLLRRINLESISS